MAPSRTAVEQNLSSSSNGLYKFDADAYDSEELEVLSDTYLEIEVVKEDWEKRRLLITALALQPFKTLMLISKPRKFTEYYF
jgi:hypothetical protein